MKTEETKPLPSPSDFKAGNKQRLQIVYYIYINHDSNWRAIVSGQLFQLKGFGLLEEAELYVHITDTSEKFQPVSNLVLEFAPSAIISTSNVNHFEYPAIKLVYELAHKNPDSFILYLHSKGMSYNVHTRALEEIALLTYTFKDWRKNLEIFADTKINKIGLMPAISDFAGNKKEEVVGGWIWFNFWYARASYLVDCDDPKISPDRHYYERWLGVHKGLAPTDGDCHNLHPVTLKGLFKTTTLRYFTPSQAGFYLQEIIKANMFEKSFTSF